MHRSIFDFCSYQWTRHTDSQVSQSVSQKVSQSKNLAVIQPADQAVSLAVRESKNQSENLSICHVIR